MTDSPNSLTLGLTTCDFLTSPVSVFLFCYYVTSSENAVVYFAMKNLAVFLISASLMSSIGENVITVPNLFINMILQYFCNTFFSVTQCTLN